MKSTSAFLRVATVPLFGAIAFLLTSCMPLFSWEYSEDERKQSPDLRFDAIVLRGNAGAVSGYQFEIYVLPHGTVVNREEHRRNCVYGSYENSGEFQYVWKGKDLYVTVEETPIDHFWPYYFTEDAQGRRTREGRVYLIFRREQPEEKAANQALQTTSVTRSGFGKVPVSDRQRRGV